MEVEHVLDDENSKVLLRDIILPAHRCLMNIVPPIKPRPFVGGVVCSRDTTVDSGLIVTRLSWDLCVTLLHGGRRKHQGGQIQD